MKKTDLKVTDVRYFRTRRGTGYECTTNINGVIIWNDGDGSVTFIELNGDNTGKYDHLNDDMLESLIDQYEEKKART